MADHDEGALVPVQPAFQPVDRTQIEVVGRLVHQQQIGVLRQRAGDGRPALLAAARALGFAAHVNAELARDGLDLMFLGGMLAHQCPVHQRGMTRQVRVLLQQHDAQGWLGFANARIGLDLPVDHAKQRGLAYAVAPDQRDAVARPDMQVQRIVIGPAEQPFAALLQGDAFEAENWGLCHRPREVVAQGRSGKPSPIRSVGGA